MTEIWLRPNRRILALAMIPAAAVAATGILLLLARAGNIVVHGLAWGLVGLGAALALGLLNQLRRPRIARQDDHLLFNLRAGSPVAVPVEVVEAFFLGQGPAHLPSVGRRPAESVNLVARLSQKAPEWAKASVKPALGNWCEGYVTIRGTWCEPLDGEVIRRLNRRLREVHEAARAAAAEGAS
jgi:hypothetical protein